jgi:hypothetical protein
MNAGTRRGWLHRSAALAAAALLVGLVAWPVASDPVAECSNDDDCADIYFCNGRERCNPGHPGADPRGCVAGTDPCQDEVPMCDERNDTCFCDPGKCDLDRDGHLAINGCCGGDDCDDNDADRYPGNPEDCDEAGKDQDCDFSTVGTIDKDGDGFIDARCWNDVRQRGSSSRP